MILDSQDYWTKSLHHKITVF